MGVPDAILSARERKRIPRVPLFESPSWISLSENLVTPLPSLVEMALSPSVNLCLMRRNILKNNLNTLVQFIESDENISKSTFLTQKREIYEILGTIKSLNEQITNSFIESEIEKETIFQHNADETLYKANIDRLLNRIEDRWENVEPVPKKDTEDLNSSHYNVTPKLNCPFFNPEDLSKDKLAYLNFFKEFRNCVLSTKSKSLRLIILKNHLRGYAQKIINHLSISDTNFDVAVEILDKEFLDREYIINSIFRSIEDSRILHENNSDSVKLFLTNLKAQIYELKNSFYLDFLEEDTPGNKYLGFVIFNKLPVSLRREIIHLVGSNYPSLNQIFEHYSDVIRTLEITKPSFSNSSRNTDKFKSSIPKKTNTSDRREKPSTLQNFYVKPGPVFYKCNFCQSNSHSAFYCVKFPSLKERLQQCRASKLCTSCTSPHHSPDHCLGKRGQLKPCWKCSSNSHAGALCPKEEKTHLNANPCFQVGDNQLLLPIVEITIGRGKREYKLNCLLDSGSQRSYLRIGY